MLRPLFSVGLPTSFAQTPEQVLASYFDAVKKADQTNANSLTARFPRWGDKEVNQKNKTLIFNFRNSSKPQTKNSKSIEDCAVVVTYESPNDPDSAYLIKQNGEWRVFPDVTGFERVDFPLSDLQLDRFIELEQWYEQQVGKPMTPTMQAFHHRVIGNTNRLVKLLDAGVSPNARSTDEYKDTLLIRATRSGNMDAANLLLARGARVDDRSKLSESTALFYAVEKGSMAMAQLLLENGADVNALDDYGRNALAVAVIAKNPRMITFLLQKGANPEQRSKDGMTMREFAEQVGAPTTKAAFSTPPASK